MSVEYTYEEKRIKLREDISLLIVPKSEEYYCWNEVSIETKTGTQKIGAYFTDPGSHERMVYNSNFVVFLQYDPYVPRTTIKNIFDIQSNQMLENTQEELLEIYNREFKVSQKMDVMAVPCSKSFTVAPEKAEEFKKATQSTEDKQQVEKMAEQFRINNLANDESILKKAR